LTTKGFERDFRDAGRKCWLVRTNREPSPKLKTYLEGVAEAQRNTSTCVDREVWWRFPMPEKAAVLVASGFRGARPKAVFNEVGAVAVGSVTGVHGLHGSGARRLVELLHISRFRSRVVAHSNGLRKVEVGQLETFLSRHMPRSRRLRRMAL